MPSMVGLLEEFGPWAIFAALFIWTMIQNKKEADRRFNCWRKDQERLYAIIESNTIAMSSLREQQKEANDLLRQMLILNAQEHRK